MLFCPVPNTEQTRAKICALTDRPVEVLAEGRNVSPLSEDQNDFFLPGVKEAAQNLGSLFKTRFDGGQGVLTDSVFYYLKAHAQHYPINVPRGLASDPARRTTLAEPGSHQPRLLMGLERHYQPAGHSQWGHQLDCSE